MVIVRSPHFHKMKGKIGPWTFQKGRGSISMHYCVKPEPPGVGGQIPQREKFRVCMEKWHALPPLHQLHLREYCLENLTNYSGCNLFMEGCTTIPACLLIIDDLDPETHLRYVVVVASHPLLKYVKVTNEAENITYWEAGVPLEE